MRQDNDVVLADAYVRLQSLDARLDCGLERTHCVLRILSLVSAMRNRLRQLVPILVRPDASKDSFKEQLERVQDGFRGATSSYGRER